MMNLVLPHIDIGPNDYIHSNGSLAEAWEISVIRCWEIGARIPTQYDQEGDPNSRDVSVHMVINPAAEPFVHRELPGGFLDNEVYVAEVVEGIHDHWIDPESGKWQYTYHERMADYKTPDGHLTNQLDYVVNGLSEAPHTRRVQMVIWKPWEDAGIGDPACLQRMWFRVYNFDGETGDLVQNCYMRSNDAFKAAWMNIYAFMEIGFGVARRISEILGAEITFKQYSHSVDSYHIYGSYFDEFERFLQTTDENDDIGRSFEGRTWTREQAQPHVIDAREQALKKFNRELDIISDDDQLRTMVSRIEQLKDRYNNDPYYPMEVE